MNVSFDLVKYLVTFVKFSVISLISGISGDSGVSLHIKIICGRFCIVTTFTFYKHTETVEYVKK